jgi:hypothetical protein
MSGTADADAAVAHLLQLDRDGRLPFAWYRIAPHGDRVEVAVPAADHQIAVDFFASHPLPSGGAESVLVDVQVLAGDAWTSEPEGEAGPDPSALDDLVGLDVKEAAARATAGGWTVRAHEPDAALTMDLRMDRVNLEYSDRGTVTGVRVG